MEKARLKSIPLGNSNVITMSGGPYAHENINDTSLFYFYGLGCDRTAPTGEDLRINNGGKNVTSDYLDAIYKENKYYQITNSTGLLKHYLSSSNGGAEDLLSEALNIKEIRDGAYTLSNGKFTYKQ